MATLAIFAARGPQKRLLGSLPKPSSAQAPHPSHPAKVAFSLALLRLPSPSNPLAPVFVGGLRALTLGPFVPKKNTGGGAQHPPFPILGEGAAVEDIPPSRRQRIEQPGPSVKGNPPYMAVLYTLDKQLPAVLQNMRQQRDIPQSAIISSKVRKSSLQSLPISFAQNN